ncbi:NAD(P)/FAD-dependent oxidoreductase [Deinococcus sonorensis]|uniref:FAD-dependent oxidoreductase n=2 Tax=Deinococcus sonorensis TaxID=309891 RepID=A0AAU7UEB5_9DEIO
MDDVLIVGAGLAGLALARQLQTQGQRVQLLDAARGVSGRCSTRRLGEAGAAEVRLDHGARYFTARHDRTRALVQDGLQSGWLREWTRSVPSWEAGQITSEPDGHPRYVPPLGMNVLGRELAEGLSVQTSARVEQLSHQPDGWLAHTDDGRHWSARMLVLNLPAHQAAALLETAALPLDLSALRAVRFDPCWAVGALLARDVPGADWPALRLSGHPSLEWICREHTKRPAGHPPALMLHARADWSRAQLDLNRDPAELQSELLEAAQEVLGPLEVQQAFIHRWRSATPVQRFPEPCGWHPEHGLGWCGDWCTPDPHGPRVEAALLSGWALADRMTG